MTYYTTLDTPIQVITLTSDGQALTGVYMTDHTRGPQVGDDWIDNADAAPLQAAREQLLQFIAGERTEFDLPLRMHGTEFQRRVWDELRKIPYGQTISYGESARRVGNPNASRAVGLANGRNPISIIVPCHRVIGASGTLTGYGGGLDRKLALLRFEAAVAKGDPRPLTACSPPGEAVQRSLRF